MSKIVYIYQRGPVEEHLQEDLERICRQLGPDHITPNPPLVYSNDGAAYGIVNPLGLTLSHNASVLLGSLFESDAPWSETETAAPDGNFAIFRADDERLEVLSDFAGSRTVWYYFDDDQFIASTSQRAVLMLLDGYEPDERVVPWVLSTGSLGPECSWDRRIKRLQRDSILSINKADWTISCRQNRVRFSALLLPEEEHEKRLRDSIYSVFDKLHYDFDNWTLPLSGGFDSRAILCLLKATGSENSGKLGTITWGLRSALGEPDTDASVAKRLAQTLEVANAYLATDLSDDSPVDVVNRFVRTGEGCIDHLGGYTDGFRLWKKLFENNVKGIIRGDEGFGWSYSRTELAVRLSTGSCLCSDYANLRGYSELTELQQLPEYLFRKEGESLATWRDRLYHEYRLPVILAALSDLKLPYVEISNPLLSRKILQQVWQLPDDLRTDKVLFQRIVRSTGPDIPFASRSATGNVIDVLSKPPVVELFRETMSSQRARDRLPRDLLESLQGRMKSEAGPKTFGLKKTARKLLPKSVVKYIKKNTPLPVVNPYVLAFRAYIICKMAETFEEDRARLRER